MIRAIVNTNVLVSGLLSPSGKEALVLLAMHRGLVRPCLSPPIREEYAKVLARPKFAFPPDEIAAVLAMLDDKGEPIQPAPSPVPSPHPDDTKFLDCAFAARGTRSGSSGSSSGKRGRTTRLASAVTATARPRTAAARPVTSPGSTRPWTSRR